MKTTTDTDSRTSHWDAVHARVGEDGGSWFEAEPRTSLRLIEMAGLDASAHVLDVGAGASRVVDHLAGRHRLTVLDVSQTALDLSTTRLGPVEGVTFVCGDVLDPPAIPPVDLWHDRAVFHFLTSESDRDRYRMSMQRLLAPGAHAIVATFAPDAPDRCSGLPVERYAPDTLAEEFPFMTAIASMRHQHETPDGRRQAFSYLLLTTNDDAAPDRERGATQ